MIALIQQNHAMPATAREEELARLNRERTFLSTRTQRHMRAYRFRVRPCCLRWCLCLYLKALQPNRSAREMRAAKL
jgi:hypothetical protein